MAQEKNNIFGTISKKNEDGFVNIPVDISKLTENIDELGFSSAFLSKDLLKIVLQEIMQNEIATFLNAEKSKRTTKRKGYRNGTYIRTLVTTVGKLKLRVPRDRNGKLIGITTFRTKDNLGNVIHGIGYVIPINRVLEYIK